MLASLLFGSQFKLMAIVGGVLGVVFAALRLYNAGRKAEHMAITARAYSQLQEDLHEKEKIDAEVESMVLRDDNGGDNSNLALERLRKEFPRGES